MNHRLNHSRLSEIELSVGESFRIEDVVVTLLDIKNGEPRFLVERLSGEDCDDDSFDSAEFELPASFR